MEKETMAGPRVTTNYMSSCLTSRSINIETYPDWFSQKSSPHFLLSVRHQRLSSLKRGQLHIATPSHNCYRRLHHSRNPSNFGLKSHVYVAMENERLRIKVVVGFVGYVVKKNEHRISRKYEST
ncbi:hypothetical protein M0R45_030915 [Rubus argutus]|uniref:Uncharacterized protein n=1 Tax=Rubus argutus TaxID=59490 RepID=A0AAW1WC27_RUBAR